MKYSLVRGTRDIFGNLSKFFNFVEEKSREIFISFGYSEIRTPIFEMKDVFIRSLGDATDIVSKEMYDFVDKGGRSLALRPEGTAPIVRALVENNLINSEQKFYYIGPMFRYDRPQAGRYRQFFQIGAEVFGVKSPLLDLEVICLATKIITSIGVDEFSLKVNSVGCLNCRDIYLEKLKLYVKDYSSSLCNTCNYRIENNILRIFDCKINTCKEILKDAPKILDFVCSDCRNDFYELISYFDKLQIEYEIDKSLVRGLDYYSGIVFEIQTDKLGSQSAIAAGGRYDNLVEKFGGKKTPAVGFAIGEDRVVEILKKSEMSFNHKTIFIISTDKENHSKQILDNFDFISYLREKGFIVKYAQVEKNIKSQMKMADESGALFAVFLESDGLFTLKNMQTGEQEKVNLEKLKLVIR